MKKILLATDFSESCQNALNYTLKLFKDENIQIDLAHVYSIPISTISMISENDSTKLIAEKMKSVHAMLDEIRSEIPEKQRGENHAVFGIYPSSDIIALSTKIEASLIVVALRQKFSMIDRFIGTITANTISKANVPVLAIPNFASVGSEKNILFPTDKPYSEEHSKEMAAEIQNLLSCCHMFNFKTIYSIHVTKEDGIDITYRDTPFEGINFIRSHAKKLDEGIHAIAEKKQVNIIAIKKSNRMFWERLYHSSLTRKLLFKARIPLLVFP